MRSFLLGGIFKDLDLSKGEMCKERLEQCKNLQLSAVQTLVHDGSYAWIFSAKFRHWQVIAKCYKQTRMELLNRHADPALKPFDYEHKSLSHLRHSNIVRLVAYDERAKCVLLEPVSHGSLLKFLRHRRTDTLAPKFTELLSMAIQVANALEYLEKNHMIHLAMQARNVLLHHGNIVKLSGFQFCRNLEHIEDAEIKQLVETRRFKWMDPQALLFESLSPRTVSWSFGVFLYELFTLGCVPFNHPEKSSNHGDFKRKSLTSPQARIFVSVCKLHSLPPPGGYVFTPVCLFVCLFVCVFVCSLVCLFVCLFVCLSVTTISQKVLNRFSRKFVERILLS